MLNQKKLSRLSVLASACGNGLESLENRQLMAASTLPLRLDFNGSVSSTILDKQGRGTGFTSVQSNKNGDQYQSALIDLDTASGTLKLTTRGNATNGSAAGLDNTATNALETSFNGNQSGFTIETRLVGPLSNLNDRFEQAGIFFGPDQDNYVKLVAGRNWNGQFLQFEDEFTNSTGGVSSTRNGTNAQTGIGSFASINTLDLRIVGDAATGKISAYYRVNSDTGSFTKVAYEVTIAEEKRSAFFNSQSKAGLVAAHKNDIGPITASFDSFGITAGAAILARPSISGLEGMSGTTLDVRRDAAIKAILSLANGNSPVDSSTLHSGNVLIYRASDAAEVAATLSLTNNGAAISIAPSALLDPNTTYTVEITSGLKDQAGAAFQPFVMSFTTGSDAGTPNLSTTGPQATFSVDKLFFNDIYNGGTNGGNASLVQKLRITNTGVANLVLGSGSLSFGGTNGGEFSLASGVTLPATIEPGAFIDVPIVFKSSAATFSSANVIRTATLTVSSNDPQVPSKAITLRGLVTAGEGGSLEPSLQRIMDLFQIPLNVGDPDATTNDYPTAPTGSDEILIQTLRKAGAGSVTIEMLANFANTNPTAARFGYYTPGQLLPNTTSQNGTKQYYPAASALDRTQLFSVPGSSAQAVRAVTNGSLSFDPTSDFGLYGEFPSFGGRIVTSESALNTWEAIASRRQKVRFFPLKNADGTTVPNAYVFTFEEYSQGYDQNDIVGIIRNVMPTPAGAEIGTINLDGSPFNDRLVMSRIRDEQVPDATLGYIDNDVHDQSTLRIVNSGTQTLNITSITISSGDFTIAAGDADGFSIAPGAWQDVPVKFVFNTTGLGQNIRNATMTINSNDADEPAKVVKLAGLWQSHSENAPNGVSQEPTAAQILQTFGYNVNVGTVGGDFAAIRRAGEEILSQMWQVADSSDWVGVRQLAAYHQQKSTTNSRVRWLAENATGVGTTIFAHYAPDGQTLLPHHLNYTTSPASDTFNPLLNNNAGGRFSWTVDNDHSIESMNVHSVEDGKHALRFYAAKDGNGKIIPNTYILLMDYVGQSFSNYDYQDNIYLLTNVRPVSGALAPANPAATTNGNGNALSWTKSTEGNVVGYNIYRSANGGAYTKVNSALVSNNAYTDAGAIVGTTYSYQIRPVDYHGTEGGSATVSATRTSDTVAPSTPYYATAFGQTGGVSLNWLDNTEGDLAGYNVYRASAIDGTYVKLNSSILTSSDYLDLSAASAQTSYYRITAIDAAGNESFAASVQTYRPANGNVPAAPTLLTSGTVTGSSITLSWRDNASDESGFIIEIKNTDGTFSQIGTTGANVTTFNATGLQGGTSYTFRVRATNASGLSGYSNEATASTQQSPPVAASNLVALALNANAVRLTWNDNALNESSYRIERRLGSSGTWSVLDTVGTNISLYVDQSALANTAYSYQVFAVNSAGTSPASNITSVTTPAADGYQSIDIGNPLAAGSTNTINPGRDYDVVAGGTDVWGTSDQFRYVYKSITGDFDYSAQVIDVSKADTLSMAGLMARETLAANSKQIFMRARSDGLRANFRSTTGGSTTAISGIPFTFPNAYVRLQRVGNVFTTYGSTDGTNWTVVTQQTIAMSTTIFLGIAANAHTTTAATTTAKIRGLTDRLAVATPSAASDLTGSADASAPSVSLAWRDNATNETGFRVERRPAGSATWSTIATLGANTTSYLDTGVSINTQYIYRVIALNDAGDAPASAELSITVANGIPTAPTSLGATNVAGGIRLAWTDNSSNETNFQLERRTANGTWASIAMLGANVTTYTDAAITAGTSYAYRIRALGSAADSGYSNEASITSPAALSYTSTDIGGAPGGSTTVVDAGNDYNVTAGGTDVWNSSDQFRFVYRQVTGNFDIRVRVASLNFASDQSMAGLMARASLDANSRNVYVKVRADGSDRMTYRASTGGASTGVGGGSSTFPNAWLRLVRNGNTFTGYQSTDGTNWTVVSTVTLSLPTTMYVGLATASHVTGVTTTAQYRDLTLA